mmetsp:Transcript_4580/g.8836  ORF Transcript_4580/g.8836 Transcript_4580/m.8836 type:complete len:292 (+) Transcript_4580:806-1681(+)
MHNILTMHINQSTRHHSHNNRCLCFSQRALLHNIIKQFTPCHEFHHNVNLIRSRIDIIQFDNVRMVQRLECLDLCMKLINHTLKPLLNLHLIYNFTRIGSPRITIHTPMTDTGRSHAQNFTHLILLHQPLFPIIPTINHTPISRTSIRPIRIRPLIISTGRILCCQRCSRRHGSRIFRLESSINLTLGFVYLGGGRQWRSKRVTSISSCSLCRIRRGTKEREAWEAVGAEARVLSSPRYFRLWCLRFCEERLFALSDSHVECCPFVGECPCVVYEYGGCQLVRQLASNEKK